MAEEQGPLKLSLKKKERWRLAQKSEKIWWEKTIAGNNFAYFAAFAEGLAADLRDIVPLDSRTRILEIGSGPAGILTHVKAGFRCGIDPLEPFFGHAGPCRAVRDLAVRYCAGQAEHLPFAANSFNLIIMDNILDHCEDIEGVVVIAGGQTIVYFAE